MILAAVVLLGCSRDEQPLPAETRYAERTAIDGKADPAPLALGLPGSRKSFGQARKTYGSPYAGRPGNTPAVVPSRPRADARVQGVAYGSMPRPAPSVNPFYPSTGVRPWDPLPPHHRYGAPQPRRLPVINAKRDRAVAVVREYLYGQDPEPEGVEYGVSKTECGYDVFVEFGNYPGGHCLIKVSEDWKIVGHCLGR